MRAIIVAILLGCCSMQAGADPVYWDGGVKIATGMTYPADDPRSPEHQAKVRSAQERWQTCLDTQAEALNDNISQASDVGRIVAKACAQPWRSYLLIKPGLSAELRIEVMGNVARYGRDEATLAVLMVRRAQADQQSAATKN